MRSLKFTFMLKLLLLSCGLTLLATAAQAEYCVLPDNGAGTVDLPPDCPNGYQGPMQIIDGLPPGTTLEIAATLTDFMNVFRFAGGTLGGEVQQFDATLHWQVTGTGGLTGYSRTMDIPVQCEVHTGPRNPGDPVQTFSQRLFHMAGQLYGDPDFCTLIVQAGDNLGLPCPGQTELKSLPDGNFNVDSFFDITYRIDFEGCPGSPLEDYLGSTTSSGRFQAGEPYNPNPEHSCILPDNGTGTIDLPPECPDGYQGHMNIVDGLPPGTTIEIDAQLTDFANIVRTPGGTLAGEIQQFDATLYWQVAGTGDLAGYSRTMAIPVECEVHTGPRNPGDPVQTFPQQLYSLSGQLFGDPDFCTLVVQAGQAHGLPSPGQSVLTELPSGDFAVDSFFDITYRIDFEGCPGSPLADFAGTTTDTDHFHAGEPYNPNPEHSCILPDNGAGTIDLPPECPDGYQGSMIIIDGLPPGTTIEVEAQLTDFANVVRFPGGTMGGEVQQFDATLYWQLTGTGDLSGYTRSLAIPVECEFHTGLRNPGDPVQTFLQDVFRLEGELFGDPDFCVLRVRAGTDFGLPSPGQAVLTELPSGDFAVDSFFDITYQIEFAGCPGSPLADLSGTTTATDHFHAGEELVTAVRPPVPVAPFVLYQNTPNPFNPATTIAYDVPQGGGRVALDIYDLSGRHVRSLVDELQTAGPKAVLWDGKDAGGRAASSGVYLYVLKTRQGQIARKMAVIK
jgi:hypothetical protein